MKSVTLPAIIYWQYFLRCLVFHGWCNFCPSSISRWYSNLEVSMSDSGVVVLGHEVLLQSEPLFSCRPDFVHQVKLQTHGLVVPRFIMIVHPIACESYLSWNNCLAPVCQSERRLPYRCSGRRSICPQYAWQLLWPYTLYPLEPSLDDFKQGSIRDLNLSVGLRVGEGGVMVFDSQL